MNQTNLMHATKIHDYHAINDVMQYSVHIQKVKNLFILEPFSRHDRNLNADIMESISVKISLRNGTLLGGENGIVIVTNYKLGYNYN